MLTRIHRTRRGQSIVIMALALVAICGMLALAIDAGRLFFERRLMQDAVDAGALAGAQDLVGTNTNPSGIPSNALFHALQDTLSVFNETPTNAQGTPFYASPPGNTITDSPNGDYSVTVVAPTGYDNKQVQVSVSFNAVATFAQVLGFNKISISATATAEAGTNPKTYAIFAYTKGGSGNTIYNDQNGIAQIDDGQEGGDVCNAAASGLTLSNAKFHAPNPNRAALNVNGHVTVYSASDNNALFQYWQAPTPFGSGQDPEPDYLQPDVSSIANARPPDFKSGLAVGASWTDAGITITNHTSITRDVYVYYPGLYPNPITIGNANSEAPKAMYIFQNGIYYMRANFASVGGYIANTSDALPHYANASPGYGLTDLPPAPDGTDGVEFVFDNNSAYSANNSNYANDGSVFFVAPSFVPTGSTHIAFYISSTNANTGTVWSETFNASASLTPKFQVWGTVFDADGSGSMTLTGVELGPHDTSPQSDGSGHQYAINGEFIGAFLNLNGGNVLGNAVGTPTTCGPGIIGQGTPALLVQYNWRFAPAPGVNSYLVK